MKSGVVQKLIYIFLLIVFLLIFNLVDFVKKPLFANYRINNSENNSLKGIPSQLSIPKLNKQIYVEVADESSSGETFVPIDENNVSWWRKGGKLGEYASLVFAGHVDRKEGGQGVFYDISKLEYGDDINVNDFLGNSYTYHVVGSKTYNENEFPMQLVFSRNDKKRLNLITCAGNFDKIKKSYQQRLVVFAEM